LGVGQKNAATTKNGGTQPRETLIVHRIRDLQDKTRNLLSGVAWSILTVTVLGFWLTAVVVVVHFVVKFW
jgi:hypothetical protein